MNNRRRDPAKEKAAWKKYLSPFSFHRHWGKLGYLVMDVRLHPRSKGRCARTSRKTLLFAISYCLLPSFYPLERAFSPRRVAAPV